MSFRILLVEDAPDIQALACAVLQDYRVEVAGTLAAARAAIAREKPDLILLDVNLPDGSGFDFYRALSTPENSLPVIFLTGCNEPGDRIEGYTLGAEDYIVKPVPPSELKVRVRARVAKLEASQSTTIRYRDLVFDMNAQRVTICPAQGPRVQADLTSLEFRILAYLARNAQAPVPREELFRAVWTDRVHVGSRTLDTHMSSLRRKIAGSEVRIRAIPGWGYTLLAESAAKPAA